MVIGLNSLRQYVETQKGDPLAACREAL